MSNDLLFRRRLQDQCIQASKNLVQSCVTSVSFPDTLDGVWGMVEKQGSIEWISDTDVLENFDVHRPNGAFWTAPKWITENDILFFYNTKRAKNRTARLLRQARNSEGIEPEFIQLLQRSQDFTDKYSGTIFACASVSGISEYFVKEPGYHFDSRCFAPIDRVHFFENPLSSDQFSQFVKIGQNTLTPIYRQQFESIKDSLASMNSLPEFLAEADFGELTFHNVSAKNWLNISCKTEVRFINELQFREYFLNYLLDEIKDERTKVLAECRCFRRGKSTGFADYFVKIGGKWIPVEAKMNVMAEKDIFEQLFRYVEIDSFSPTLGIEKGKVFQTVPASISLIADQAGVYLFSEGKLLDCDIGFPRWTREGLNRTAIAEIREKFIELSNS